MKRTHLNLKELITHLGNLYYAKSKDCGLHAQPAGSSHNTSPSAKDTVLDWPVFNGNGENTSVGLLVTKRWQRTFVSERAQKNTS